MNKKYLVSFFKTRANLALIGIILFAFLFTLFSKLDMDYKFYLEMIAIMALLFLVGFVKFKKVERKVEKYDTSLEISVGYSKILLWRAIILSPLVFFTVPFMLWMYNQFSFEPMSVRIAGFVAAILNILFIIPVIKKIKHKDSIIIISPTGIVCEKGSYLPRKLRTLDSIYVIEWKEIKSVREIKREQHSHSVEVMFTASGDLVKWNIPKSIFDKSIPVLFGIIHKYWKRYGKAPAKEVKNQQV